MKKLKTINTSDLNWNIIVYLCFTLGVSFFRQQGKLLLQLVFDYHPILFMALFLNPHAL